MTTEAISGFGTTIKWNGVAIAEVKNISGPNQSLDTIDVTNHDSADGFREIIAGLGDGGEITLTGNHIPHSDAGQAAMLTDFQAKTKREVIITLPTATGTTWTATCLITALEQNYPDDAEIDFSATLKVSGMPVRGITYATGPTDIVVTGSVSGALTEVPDYAAGVYAYIVDGALEASVTVTVTAPGADTITVNGNSVTSGVASAAIATTSGEITTITVVVGETGKASKTYVISVSDGV